MTDYNGLYEKYEIKRIDGRDEPGQKHDGCALFVLDLTHDPAARKALRQYARSCETQKPGLAREIRGLLGRHEPTGPCGCSLCRSAHSVDDGCGR